MSRIRVPSFRLFAGAGVPPSGNFCRLLRTGPRIGRLLARLAFVPPPAEADLRWTRPALSGAPAFTPPHTQPHPVHRAARDRYPPPRATTEAPDSRGGRSGTPPLEPSDTGRVWAWGRAGISFFGGSQIRPLLKSVEASPLGTEPQTVYIRGVSSCRVLMH